MEQRYDCRKEADGTWTVMDLKTGYPAVVNGAPQAGLDIQDADEAAELLDKLMDDGEAEEIEAG